MCFFCWFVFVRSLICCLFGFFLYSYFFVRVNLWKVKCRKWNGELKLCGNEIIILVGLEIDIIFGKYDDFKGKNWEYNF